MEWIGLISAAAALSGIVLGWIGRARTIKMDGEQDGELRASVDYIKRGIDEMRLEQKDQGRRFDALSERVAKVEESNRSAHKRIDRLEEVRGS